MRRLLRDILRHVVLYRNLIPKILGLLRVLNRLPEIIRVRILLLVHHLIVIRIERSSHSHVHVIIHLEIIRIHLLRILIVIVLIVLSIPLLLVLLLLLVRIIVVILVAEIIVHIWIRLILLHEVILHLVQFLHVIGLASSHSGTSRSMTEPVHSWGVIHQFQFISMQEFVQIIIDFSLGGLDHRE